MTTDTRQHPQPFTHFAGHVLMVLGGFVAVGVLGYAAAEPMNVVPFSALLVASAALFVTGLVAKASAWVVGELGGPQEENNVLLRQMSAAPTVNLHEARQLFREQLSHMQEQVMLGQTMVTNRLNTTLADRIEAAAHASSVKGVEDIVKSIEELRHAVHEMGQGVAKAAEQSYADGLVDGASGVATVRRIHPRPDASPN